MTGSRKILVGFATKTSAVLPRFFCALFRHCAVVIDGTLIQIGPDGVRLFRVRAREIGKLEAAGWVFLRVRGQGLGTGVIGRNVSLSANHESRVAAREPLTPVPNPCPSFLTCVGFAKRALGIRAPFVWTPDQLFRMIVNSYKL
jgi:hypothetical protein